MKRPGVILSLVLMLAAPAFAQEAPAPRTDIAALRKEAKADVAVRKALGDLDRSMDSRLRDDRRYVDVILHAAASRPGDRVLDIASGSGYLALLFASLVGDKGHVDIHNTPGWIAQFPSISFHGSVTQPMFDCLIQVFCRSTSIEGNCAIQPGVL